MLNFFVNDVKIAKVCDLYFLWYLRRNYPKICKRHEWLWNFVLIKFWACTEKSRKYKNFLSRPSLCKCFPNIFMRHITKQIFGTCWGEKFNWSPIFIHILTRACWNCYWLHRKLAGYMSYPNMKKKRNWYKGHAQISWSEIAQWQENSRRGGNR